MNINVNLNLKVETLAELLATIETLKASGVTPTVSAVPETVRPTRPITRGTHPLETKYNEVSGKQFRITRDDCKVVGWNGPPGEIPEAQRLSAIAGRLLGLGVATEEVQALCAADYSPDNNETEEELPPGIAPIAPEAGENEPDGDTGGDGSGGLF